MAARIALLAGVAVTLFSAMSIAQDSKNQGYLVDSYGNNISTSSNTGLCWRSSDWTPARSVEPCDPVAKKAEAPAPRVAAAVRPPEAVPAAAAKPAPRVMTFSADALFAFNKSLLKPEGKAALDDFSRQLGSARYDTILVTGHADRFGSNEYNQKLSERRANAVKDYLVSRNIPADRITAEGRGETQPVTLSGACNGPRSIKMIECLQPDRRVHAEATGTADLSASSR